MLLECNAVFNLSKVVASGIAFLVQQIAIHRIARIAGEQTGSCGTAVHSRERSIHNLAKPKKGQERTHRTKSGHFVDLSRPPSTGNSTVPAIETHCSLGTATMRPSVFRQLPDPS
jgi:hypothetical protein